MAPSTDSTWRPPATDSSWPPPTPEPAFQSAPPPPEASWRPPTSPRGLASTVVASVQYVTSSVRLLFSGCFQCQTLKGGGCWRRQEETDGAWFDCEKLQVEHPYCYINPVALTESQPAGDDAVPNGTVLSQQPKPSSKSPLLVPAPPVKSSAEGSSDTKISKDVVPNGTFSSTADDSVVYKNGRVRSGLVESFAAKLEADLRRIECDRQRSEGEVVPPSDDQVVQGEDVVISFPDYLCPEVDFFKDGGTDSPYQYDEFKGNKRLNQDVWKPSELEDVFECYNMAAFYSYGASVQIGEKSSAKNKGEKFEEVFPASFNNNNNTIKVYRPAVESESPLSLKDENDQEVESPDGAICERKRHVTEEELKQLVKLCIYAESIDEVNSLYNDRIVGSTDNCDDGNETNHYAVIHYGSKSFNTLLIFNLVKIAMAECHEDYFHSMNLCAEFPDLLVQNKILSALKDDENVYQLVMSGLQAFRNSNFISGFDAQQLQRQLVAERIVEKTVNDELRRETKEWQDVSHEEGELKEAISTELFHDLIDDTALLFDNIVRRKLM